MIGRGSPATNELDDTYRRRAAVPSQFTLLCMVQNIKTNSTSPKYSQYIEVAALLTMRLPILTEA